MLKKQFLLLVLLLIKNCFNDENNLSIEIINSKVLSYFINPVIDKDNNLFIITGDYSEKETNKYTRNILKINSSGSLIYNKSFKSNYNYKYTEISYIRNDNNKKDYLIIITSSSIELYDIKNNIIISEIDIDNALGYRTPMIQLEENKYMFAFKEKEGSLIFGNLLIDFDNNQIKKINEKINGYNYNNDKFNETIISCDIAHDNDNDNDSNNKYILCVYINDKKQLEISSFSYDFELINKKIDESILLDDRYFIKIVYFKYYNKFVVMNALNQTYTRLRYFKYKNNMFLNQLTFITDDEKDYLDENIAQISPYLSHNDIISLNSRKIIRISINSNDAIISRYQFHSNDISLSIKNYKLNEILNNNNYMYFLHPRLVLLNSIIVICLSTLYLNERRTGYFYISYPSPTNITINNNNNIQVNELMTIKNNLFKYIPKIIIEEIPDGFIFYNFSDNIIKNKTNLDHNDSMILKEYKNISSYNLIYQVLSIKNKTYINKHSQMKIYPSEEARQFFEESEIIIQGEKGALNISIPSCNNNFYFTEIDNVCTKIAHEGYYVDEKNKIYRKCYYNCKLCEGPYIDDLTMNCKECRDGYYKVYNTSSCFNETPYYHYFDEKDKIYKKCHESCYECFNYTNNSCISCIENYTFILSNNTCVSVNESKSRNEIEIKLIEEETFKYVFIIIFIIAIISSFICIIRPLKKNELETTRYTFLGSKKYYNNNANNANNKKINNQNKMQEMPLFKDS